MGITETDNKFLNALVHDSIVYNLSIAESMEYIKTRFKEISIPSYKQRKAKALSEDSTQLWLNHFTRIGFVTHQKQQIEHIQKLQEDSMRQLFIESTKNQDQRNETKILALKQDIRSNVKLLSELAKETPIISAVKAKLEELYHLNQARELEQLQQAEYEKQAEAEFEEDVKGCDVEPGAEPEYLQCPKCKLWFKNQKILDYHLLNVIKCKCDANANSNVSPADEEPN